MNMSRAQQGKADPGARRHVLLDVDPVADFGLVARICQMTDGADPFLRSAAYVAMTGRKGLWIYGDERAALLLCRHPNRDGQLLVFPPVGAMGAALLRDAMADPRLPPGNVQLARMTQENNDLVTQLGAIPDREPVLDWAYPVHEVSTGAITARTGGRFNNLRGHLHRAVRSGLWWQELDGVRDGAEIADVARAWADKKAGQGFTADDLIGPTMACLTLLNRKRGQLGGVVVRHAQGPAGFWIWDQISETKAVSLVRISAGGHGAAELGAAAAAELLHARGVSIFSLGGSETASLDQFKRKLGPVRSIDLQSAMLPR